MRKMFPMVMLMASLCFLATPIGCSKTTLSKDGVYHGDVLLYQSEKLTVGAHNSFKKFLIWEGEFRSVLPAAVSQAADLIRNNEEKWIGSANALHDAYVATPSVENKNKLQLALNLIDAALVDAAKYITANAARAPAALETRQDALLFPKR